MKAVDAARYFLTTKKVCDKINIDILLYFVQCSHIIKSGTPFFNESIILGEIGTPYVKEVNAIWCSLFEGRYFLDDFTDQPKEELLYLHKVWTFFSHCIFILQDVIFLSEPLKRTKVGNSIDIDCVRMRFPSISTEKALCEFVDGLITT